MWVREFICFSVCLLMSLGVLEDFWMRPRDAFRVRGGQSREQFKMKMHDGRIDKTQQLRAQTNQGVTMVLRHIHKSPINTSNQLLALLK